MISPALDALKVEGRTTADSLKQGNIRSEMFHRLLTADLVVHAIEGGDDPAFATLSPSRFGDY